MYVVTRSIVLIASLFICYFEPLNCILDELFIVSFSWIVVLSLCFLFVWLCWILVYVVFSRAGELSAAELDQLMVVVANPRQFKIPDWFLNRQKDYKDGRYSQVVSNALDMKLRDDLERLKKIRYGLVVLLL